MTLRGQQDSQRWSQLTDTFALHGGMLEADLLTDTMRQDHGQPISVLSRWIVERRVLALRLHSSIRVPLFQFLPAPFRPHPTIREVLEEFAEVFDDWEVAQWFVAPNSSLGGALPVQRLRSDPGQVVSVTRIDRYVARG